MSWLHLAIGSGLAAAFNGLFAKLTTTVLTTSLSSSIARLLSFPGDSKAVEYVVRGIFFGLNLLFNAIMWGLFTAALAKGPTATKVSIVNTSANFMVCLLASPHLPSSQLTSPSPPRTTALLGWAVFTETLPPTWWLGAGLLVAGNVIIGRRDEEDKTKDSTYQAVTTNGARLRTSEGSVGGKRK
ncbi:hypothetical protein L873DRAFT_1812060 [Choiromyces venosus 120613-1]|uniref:Uncharacterized protein n=1 Tax=Choiromyces venosus 120613-1 TaxID=1336337 RepID=A0A3N4JQ46_9PEZI|nr:hypothetical protein L873DRAFT_1812060 [Choiromyces venosus 120613-1]